MMKESLGTPRATLTLSTNVYFSQVLLPSDPFLALGLICSRMEGGEWLTLKVLFPRLPFEQQRNW